MVVVDEPSDPMWDCGRLNVIHDKMVEVMEQRERTSMYSIELVPHSSFVDKYKRTVGGYTDCWSKTVVVGNAPVAFPHELAHVLQNCNARQPSEDGNDYDHANWTKDGIFALIEEVAK